MKKLLVLFLLGTALALCGCGKKNEQIVYRMKTEEEKAKDEVQYSFTKTKDYILEHYPEIEEFIGEEITEDIIRCKDDNIYVNGKWVSLDDYMIDQINNADCRIKIDPYK